MAPRLDAVEEVEQGMNWKNLLESVSLTSSDLHASGRRLYSAWC